MQVHLSNLIVRPLASFRSFKRYVFVLAGSRAWFGLHFRAAEVRLPTGIRHWDELSDLHPGQKRERETLWQIVHALSVLLDKNFNAGVASYAAGEH